MATTKKKFASQADAALLERLTEIAREEGRHFQAVLEDAMRVYLEQRDAQTPRASVMANFRASVEHSRRLGKLLAKEVRDYPTLAEVLAMHQVRGEAVAQHAPGGCSRFRVSRGVQDGAGADCGSARGRGRDLRVGPPVPRTHEP